MKKERLNENGILEEVKYGLRELNTERLTGHRENMKNNNNNGPAGK